jgi:hypothetical protein
MPMLMTLRRRLPVWPFPRPAADSVAKIGHSVEHGVDLGHHVLGVYNDRCSPGGTQRHMQHGSPLRDVDLLPPEHRIDLCTQAGCFRQIEQKLEGFCGDAIFRVIEVDPRGFCGQAFATLRVLRKELPQMQSMNGSMMVFKGLPGWAYRQWLGACGHVPNPSGSSRDSTRRGAPRTLSRLPESCALGCNHCHQFVPGFDE